MSFLLMASSFVAKGGMISMASQKHQFIAIMSSLKMGFVNQCMVMMVSQEKKEIAQNWMEH